MFKPSVCKDTDLTIKFLAKRQRQLFHWFMVTTESINKMIYLDNLLGSLCYM